MKKLIKSVTALGLLAATGLTFAVPTVEEVTSDIEEFQGYFKKKFPDVTLEAYKDGINALPQYAERRANWEMLMEFPPFEEHVEKGLEEWATPLPNGTTLDACFEGKPPGNEYPYVDADGKIHSIETDINACLTANGAEKEKYTGQKMARLTVAYKSRANGEPMNVDYSSDAMRAWYEKGRQFYWAKRGQLNLSCADCHVHNSSNKMRGDVLSAGLGHGTGFPVYRTKWAVANSKKPMGTLHRRYKGCNQNIRAEPFKPGGEEYLALEAYEAIMNTGVPLSVPSQRQ